VLGRCRDGRDQRAGLVELNNNVFSNIVVPLDEILQTPAPQFRRRLGPHADKGRNRAK